MTRGNRGFDFTKNVTFLYTHMCDCSDVCICHVMHLRSTTRIEIREIGV